MPDYPDTQYLDPRTGDTFPLDPPRWCGPDGAPLMLTPLRGMARTDIDTVERSPSGKADYRWAESVVTRC